MQRTRATRNGADGEATMQTTNVNPDQRLILAMASYLDRAARFYARRQRLEQAQRYTTAARRYHARALASAIARGPR